MKKVRDWFFVIAIILSVISCSSLIFVFGKNGKKEDTDTSGNNTQIEQQIDFSDMTYIAFGDSITYGADYTRAYAPMDNPYPKLVGELLNLKDVRNDGDSGATLCSNSLNRGCIVNNVSRIKVSYDIVSLLGGVNDFNCSLPLGVLSDTTSETIYGSLDAIASYFTTNFSDSFIFFMTPYKCNTSIGHWSNNNTQGYNLEDVANAVKQVANKYNIPVLDLFNEGQFELEMYTSGSDGLHPSQEFVTNYTAPQIAQFIKTNYKQK